MTNAELIDSLRNVYGEKADCYHCHSNMGCYGTACMEYLCHDAADALEAAEKRIAELMPKEGEWIEVHDWLQIPQEECGTYRCSACGQVMKYPWNYCPYCGARMKGERQC